DVCSSDLARPAGRHHRAQRHGRSHRAPRPGAIPVDLQALPAEAFAGRRREPLSRPAHMSGHDIPDPGAPGPEPQPAPGWRALPAQARNLFMLSGLVLAVPAGIAARLGMRALDLPGGWTASLVAALLGALAGSWMGLRRYRYTRWLLDADGFSLRRGRTWQSEVRVPVNRVQHLDVRRGP